MYIKQKKSIQILFLFIVTSETYRDNNVENRINVRYNVTFMYYTIYQTNSTTLQLTRVSLEYPKLYNVIRDTTC